MKNLFVVLMAALLVAPAFAGEFVARQGEKVEGEYLCTFAPGANARGLTKFTKGFRLFKDVGLLGRIPEISP